MPTTIADELDKIRRAIYGEEVRGSIVSAIEKCYEDTENGVTAATAAASRAESAANNAQSVIAMSVAQVAAATSQALSATESAMSGPNIANTAADMVDHDKVYVYQGSESGYTAGHWYAYRNNTWRDCGVYKSVIVDKTLAVSDTAADAKTVGDRITSLSGQVSTLNSQLTHLENEVNTHSGLSTDAKNALMDLVEHIAIWSDDQASVYVEALRTALFPPRDVQSITAIYTQSGTVYDTDTLDSLRSDITVTVHYSDGDETTSGYSLSGTLVRGESVITVLFGGKSTTITVTVTHNAQSGEVVMSSFAYHNSVSQSGFKLYSDGGNTEYSDSRFPPTNAYTSISDVFEADANLRITLTPTANTFKCLLLGSSNFDNSISLATNNGSGYWLKYVVSSSPGGSYGWSSASSTYYASVKAGTRFMIMANPSCCKDIACYRVEVI